MRTMSQIPIPEEIKPFTKTVSYDPSRNTVIIVISAKLMFSTVLANLQNTNMTITQVIKQNEKIFVYTKVNVQLPEPFETFDGRLTISQAKLDSMMLSQMPNVHVYYKQENDDLLILIEVPVQGVGNVTPQGQPQVPW
ncbi:hypothetical protein SBFV2_gp52 [Sulfolobales Beppu filamentous virus 2]|uniref:Uncharacterized protein n=1 Tax=Sulfolobales Beppu filamentous virus 2 TaxID=2493123 RepID=A0A3Q8Q3T3_9VIRU|nr:hypothetical protein HOU84_gp52 [Sulfolobales Beppu filamentous virus 2]AZI75819.1 hypothetical protein SBFV2_gp52 [Sulfolobales Beppu filamentous virus 2]